MNTDHIWTDINRRLGKPCVRDTRFTVAQLLAELSEDTRCLETICKNFRIDQKMATGAIQDVCKVFSTLRLNTTNISSDPATRGGHNCIRGSRFPIGFIFAELAACPQERLCNVARNLDIPMPTATGILWEVSSLLDQDWSGGTPDMPAAKIIREDGSSCWYCHGEEGEMVFSLEFDCYLHLRCLKSTLEKNDPDDREAQILAREFPEVME